MVVWISQNSPDKQTNRRYVCVYVCTYVCMIRLYYKEFIDIILEADKSQDLQLVSWRPRRADSVILVQMQAGSKSRKSQYFNSAEGRKKLMS